MTTLCDLIRQTLTRHGSPMSASEITADIQTQRPQLVLRTVAVTLSHCQDFMALRNFDREWALTSWGLTPVGPMDPDVALTRHRQQRAVSRGNQGRLPVEQEGEITRLNAAKDIVRIEHRAALLRKRLAQYEAAIARLRAHI